MPRLPLPSAQLFEPAQPRPPSPIESLNTLTEDEFRNRFLPPDHRLGCNGKVRRSSRPEELIITPPAPEDNLSRVRDVNVNSSQYIIRFNTASNIHPEDLEACFKLVEFTSSLDYKSSSVGWSATQKREEMADPDMKYLLLTDGTSYKVDGFLSFMLTREDELPVIYCYEIHISPDLQGRGIGRKLMGLMENIGQQAGVKGSMLTVFTKNEVARKMYERMGYSIHDSSPSPRRLRGRIKEPDYQILWKTLADGD